MAATNLNDVSLDTLLRILRATEKLVDPDAASVRVLRRVVEAKRREQREAECSIFPPDRSSPDENRNQ